MSKGNFLFSSESVSEGHPDLVADQIADAIKDEILRQDPFARTGIEVFLPKGTVHVGGEVTTSAYVDIEDVVRKTILDIGYDNPEYGLDGRSVGVINSIVAQSPEIAGGVFNSLEQRLGIAKDELDKQGSGDQGNEFGSAQSHNKIYFPAPFTLARLLTQRLAQERKAGSGAGILLPDAKSQLTIEFNNNIPVRIHNILISTQHTKDIHIPELQEYVREYIIKPVLEDYNENYSPEVELIDSKNYLINPAGEWNIGGPASDSGLTGRKLQILIGNGAWTRHGGGNASGKDGSKTDASAAVYSRWVAKHLVAAGIAKEVEIQVSYAIGSAHPLSLYIDTKGEIEDTTRIEQIIAKIFDFRPASIFEQLHLEQPIYREASRQGYLGREEFSWEKLTKLTEIENLL